MRRESLILLVVLVTLFNFGCKKIQSLEEIMLKPEKEAPAATIKPLEDVDLAQAILWPKPYKFKLQRDPFRPLMEKSPALILDSGREPLPKEFKIRLIGIAIKKDKPVALLELAAGSFIFHEGSKVGQYIVKKIERKRVILEEEQTHKSLILKIGEEK